jgi:hypothetical protein
MRARILALLALTLLAAGCASRPNADEIGVHRGDGPLEAKSIKGVVCPGTGSMFVWNDEVHYYPHAGVQRYYTITADPTRSDSGGIDVVKVQTADGKLVGLEGTIFFTTAFDCVDVGGQDLVKSFDTQFGVRKFPFAGGNYHPYEGTKGWSAFLDAIVRPVIDNELRQAIATFDCDELQSSCALVSSQGKIVTDAKGGQRANLNLEKVQAEVEAGLKRELLATLGQPYLKNLRFRLSKVVLEPELQAAINRAQASFAQIATATAEVQQAEQKKLAAEKLAAIYERSPQLAELEMLRILCGVGAGGQQSGAKDAGCKGASIYIGVQPVGPVQASRR